MTEHRIEHLTSPEVAAAIAAGAGTAVLPLGAIEQHGPHLPLSVDSDHADRLGVLVAERLGDALVLPTVRLGCSDHHLGFAGTLSLRAATLEAICADCCASAAAHGFRRILIFSAHVGNHPVLTEIGPRLAGAAPAGFDVLVFADAQAMLDCWRDAAERVGGLADRVGGHADVAESSIMLAVRPDAVRDERLATGYTGPVDDEVLARIWAGGIEAVAPNGVLGDPHGMSVALGEACLDAVAERLATFARTRYRSFT